MEEKELKERCERLFGAFNALNEGPGYTDELPLCDYIDYFEMLKSKGITGETQDRAREVMFEVRGTAFALGFVIGQKFELTHPDAQEDVEAIYREIKEHGLLPYLPREKKAA